MNKNSGSLIVKNRHQNRIFLKINKNQRSSAEAKIIFFVEWLDCWRDLTGAASLRRPKAGTLRSGRGSRLRNGFARPFACGEALRAIPDSKPSLSARNPKRPFRGAVSGGERGIRTPGELPHASFQD